MPAMTRRAGTERSLEFAAQVPVVTGEFDGNCGPDDATTLDEDYMSWADSEGVSYLAWGWWEITPSCSGQGYSLLNDDGSAASPDGTALQSHLAELAATTTTTTTTTTSDTTGTGTATSTSTSTSTTIATSSNTTADATTATGTASASTTTAGSGSDTTTTATSTGATTTATTTSKTRDHGTDPNPAESEPREAPILTRLAYHAGLITFDSTSRRPSDARCTGSMASG